MMKYAQNHPWKFRNVGIAWGIGLTNALVIMTLEMINLIILVSDGLAVVDIIMNFLALCVIAEFDDFFAQTLIDNTIFGKLEDKCEISRLGLLI